VSCDSALKWEYPWPDYVSKTTSSLEDGETAGNADLSPGDGSVARHIPRRLALIAFLIAAVVLVGAMAVISLFAAAPIPELTEAMLEIAEERWQRAAPENYDIDIELRGAQPGTVEVQVRGGEVATLTRDGRTPQPRTWRYWSVPGMFETLERELVLAEDPQHEAAATAGSQWQLRCEFDPRFGYPGRYHRFVSGGGPEVYWRVTRFEAK
jgi:hypothetical protein